jgi:microcystin-dependent protein
MLFDELHGTDDIAIAISTKGTLAARPGAGTMGRFYHATDVGALYRDTGTTWELVSVVGGAGAFSSRPAAGILGRYYEATDQQVLYRDTGSAWQAIVFPLSGLLSARPTPAVSGRQYLATDVKVVYVDNASAWEPLPAVLTPGLLSARPASAVEGRFFRATDVATLYRDNGGGWDNILLNGGASSGTLAGRPAAGVLGRWYLTTDTNTLYRDNGAAWEVPGGEPGELIFSAALTVPGRVLKCEGQPVSRGTYAALWKALGETSSKWGQGDGVNTFNVPDFRERVPMGAGGTPAVGVKSGSTTTTLETVHMPKHKHGVAPYLFGNGDFGNLGNRTAPGFVVLLVASSGYQGAPGGPGYVGDAINGDADVEEVGGGQPHSIMQPSTVCNVWIRY